MVDRFFKLATMILALSLFVSAPAFGWFTWSDEWSYVYIAKINYQDVAPTANDTAPEATTESLPLGVTVRVKDSDLWSINVTHVELQYKDSTLGVGSWHSIDPVYDDATKNFEFEDDQFVFGQDSVTADSTDIDPGDTVLIRLYVSNDAGGYENADKAVDTTAEGTNGWLDQWVVSVPTSSNQLPTW